MRRVSLLIASSLLIAAAGCRSTPPLSVKNGLMMSPRLASLAPSNIAILPVEDATVNRDFGGQEEVLRAAVARMMPSRQYAPIDDDFVDQVLGQRGGVTGSVTDPGYVGLLRGAFEADAILGIRVTQWNVADVMRSPPQVRFSVDVLMIASESDEQLITGTYSGVLKPGGESAAPLERSDRIRAAADTLGLMLAETFPVRPIRPGGS